VFSAMFVQALPFLVLGVVISAVIAAFVPPDALRRLLDRPARVSLPMATAGGVVLPGCECSAVPVADRMRRAGVPFSSALAFAMASPALNPVVMVATATAFPGQPQVVLARFVASATVVLTTAAVIHRRRVEPSAPRDLGAAAATAIDAPPRPASRWRVFVDAVEHDLLHTAGYLVIGAALAATLRVFVPSTWLDSLAGTLVTAVIALAILAVVMSICSEADAFVAASLAAFPMSARLAFMVVGPAVDLRLVTLYRAGFGAAVTRVLVPTAFVTAVVASLIVGWIVW
jgi:uncharacterized membrane protein YraQ (UPF0718 family)